MTATQNSPFEIDQPEIYGQFLLRHPVEILAYLRALEKQQSIITIYIDNGERFFISTLAAVDEPQGRFFLDVANASEIHRLTDHAPPLTLTATLNKVKIQIKVNRQSQEKYAGHSVLSAPLPTSLLRLQRREYFRLETPLNPPPGCKLAGKHEDGTTQVHNLSLLDISGGGVSLMAPAAHPELFLPGSIFPDCRLEIPGEGFIAVNLCVKKTAPHQNSNGQLFLRISCEFVSLPGAQLAKIQRYITRIERERKARQS